MSIKKYRNLLLAVAVIFSISVATAQNKTKANLPWKNGKLMVSEEGRYLRHKNGTPFFWLGDTGWLLPERLNRDEIAFYLECCKEAGYNVVQIQTINDVPAINTYGQYSMPKGFNFTDINRTGEYGYWDHMDYIIQTAERNGIYIGMVCIWGGLVKKGLMNIEDAKAYGTFLAERYKNSPNIIWIIGGDIRGDIKTEVWETLARTIKSIDKKHLMTFHPFGRTTSATWFNNAEWLDFNMFQSGHRRYGQSYKDANPTIEKDTEEDNWRYVEACLAQKPQKPVIDGEPIYEDIPQGLHDPNEPRWKDCDVRRYAYWAVFSGAFGHTYGNNNIMQFYHPGISPAYGANKPWWDALNDPGFNQMKYLKALISAFPYFERIPDQNIIAGQNGKRYERIAATRGKDYLLVYNYTGRPMQIDLTRISGLKKNAWWYNPQNGQLKYIGEFENKITTFQDNGETADNKDQVLIAIDASKDYMELFEAVTK